MVLLCELMHGPCQTKVVNVEPASKNVLGTFTIFSDRDQCENESKTVAKYMIGAYKWSNTSQTVNTSVFWYYGYLLVYGNTLLVAY